MKHSQRLGKAVLIAALAVLALVAACTPAYETTYGYIEPQTPFARICAEQCYEEATACTASCRAVEQSCVAFREQRAMVAQRKYAEKRLATGRPVVRDFRDFLDVEGCFDPDCVESCENVRRVCHKGCGGQVIESRTCTARCEAPPSEL